MNMGEPGTSAFTWHHIREEYRRGEKGIAMMVSQAKEEGKCSFFYSVQMNVRMISCVLVFTTVP
jgi:hypothetical protein